MNDRLVRRSGSLILLVGGLLGCESPGAPATDVEESQSALSAAPWADKDIGTTGATGSASFTAPDTFDVNGSGSDIYGTSDSFHFVYQAITGDATLIAQVAWVPTTNAWAKAGVMIRESLNSNAKEMLAAVTPGNGVTSQKRTSTGGSTSFMTAGGLIAPTYVKIQRSGSTFTTSRSADGKTWTTLETATITMTSSAYIGLAVTAHNFGATCAARFKAVSLISNGGPNITTQPQDLTVIQGTSAVFTVAATGLGTLSYQWYQVTSTGTYALAPGNSLTINTNPGPGSPTPPFTNKYYCVVKDGSGRTVQSRTASLTVNGTTFTLKGRLAIPDAYDCTGGTTSQAMTWADCHRFKQHFDPSTGAAITGNSYVPGALRPLKASFYLVYQSWPDGAVCDGPLLQTDADGSFSANLTRCTAASQAVFNLTIQLKYDVTAADAPGTTLGNVRALWARELIPQSYFAGDADVQYTGTDVHGVVSHYVIPTVTVGPRVVTLPTDTLLDLGTVIADGSDYPAEYRHYVQGAQSAWQNMVAVHAAARTALRDGSSATPYADYSQLFTTAAYMNCTQCYSLWFDLPGGFGGGVGGSATMVTAAPAPNITDQQQAGLSAAGLIAHEFGHGIHESLAWNSMQTDDYFHAAARNPDGSEYGVSHMTFVPVTSNVYQQQESGQALVEGFAEAMARFLLLDGCNGHNATFEAPGSEDMLATMWNPAHYTSCDPIAGTGCPFHNFRRQMHARGIAEGSAEWNRRLNALSTLASNAAAGGMKRVLSNNEGKAATYFCKLLAQEPDYTTMASVVNGATYIDDYLYLVSEILDGRTPTPTWRSYSQGLTSERAHVSLLSLMRSLKQLCPDCAANPALLPTPLWKLASLTDGGNADYDSKRISIYGMLSAQQLSQILINQGLASKSAINNLLRASFMEELP